MEEKQNKQKIKIVRRKKKIGVWVKITIILCAVIVVCVLAAGVLGLNLLNRLYRPETPTVFAPDEEGAEQDGEVSQTPATYATPNTTLSPAASPTPTPEVVLPLAELYTQTILSEQVLSQMDAQASDARYTNILLIGVDRRGTSGNSRADTLMIATIDRVNKRLKLTSILRDTLVNIEGAGYGKLNSSAAKGGVSLLLKTINDSFHLNIENYVLVDFNMFEQIIDELGGITVEMTAAEISAANDCIAGLNKQRGVAYLWDGFIFANAGNVKLTGKQALGFARVRHLDSDFNRTNRQFSVLTAVFAKFRKAGLTKQYDMLDDILPLVETNMTNASILDCMLSALSLNTDGLLHFRAPADGLYQSGSYNRSSVLLSDIPANAWAMHQFIFDSAAEPKKATVLKPGESLPPRTPTPTYVFPEYSDGIIIDPSQQYPQATLEVTPEPVWTSEPTATPAPADTPVTLQP